MQVWSSLRLVANSSESTGNSAETPRFWHVKNVFPSGFKQNMLISPFQTLFQD